MNPNVRTYCRLLNVFENDSGSPEAEYKPIYLYHDGNGKRLQVTLARGFTSDGGSLQKVLALYVKNGGKDAEFMRARLSASTPAMVADKEFLKRLRDAGDEQVMKDAQDSVFESVYLNPGLRWADANGFTLPLSVGAVVDSYLHSGGMSKRVVNAFPERVPAKGGDEKTWIKSYLRARLAWFEGASGALHNTTYRPKFFLGEIAKGNWALSAPLFANGSRVI